MKRHFWIVFLILFLAGFANSETLPYKSDELLVIFADKAEDPLAFLTTGLNLSGPLTRRARKEAISDSIINGSTIRKEFDRISPGLSLVKLPQGLSVTEALFRFSVNANVIYAEPDYKIRLCAPKYPNDDYFNEQWALHNIGRIGSLPDADIDAPEAWGIHTGDSNDPNVIVAVIDTGIDYTHPDINDNLMLNLGEIFYDPCDPNVMLDPDEVDNDDNGYVDDQYGYDFADDDPDPMDTIFHGTHVAGIIGATGNNGMGIAGVCWDVDLLAVKIFPDDYDVVEGIPDDEVAAFVSDAIDGLDFAIVRNATIINASWETSYLSLSFYLAMQRVHDAGILFVAAAGNDSMDTDFWLVYLDFAMYPAAFSLDFDNIIVVMATDCFDQVAPYSNYGSMTVHLAAPGGDMISVVGEDGGIYSTLPMEETDAMGELELPTEYGFLEGTSMAAPHVSGAAALMWSYDPTLTYHQIKTIILYSVDKLPSLQGQCISEGRLNLYNCMNMVRGGAVWNDTQSTDHTTIQAAITAAVDGDELIAQSDRWYFENVNFLGKKIYLRSGDFEGDDPIYSKTNIGPISPSNTFISGIMGTTGWQVTFQTGEDANTILEGFTIEQGQGGISCNGTSPIISHCNIFDNSSFNGGAVICSNGSTPTVEDCNIANNTASNRGGGVYCSGGSAPIFTGGTDIHENTAPNGGGIYCTGASEPDLSGCSIYNNTATSNGGGLYLNQSSPVIDISIHSNNAGVNGGGIYCYNSSPLITTGGLINSNYAGGGGGGIYISTNSEPQITDFCVISNNWAYYGGGIYCADSDLKINDCTISGNHAQNDGGGIYLDNATLTEPIKNCLILDNYVDSWDGGGIYLVNSSPEILNCTFAGNSAKNVGGYGGGICCYDSSSPEITNCIFVDSGHFAVAVLEDSYGAPSDPFIRNCLFYENSYGDYAVYDDTVPGLTVVATGADEINALPLKNDNIDGDPMFVIGRLGNYYLSQSAAGQLLDAQGNVADPPSDADSPAVDAGLGLAVDLSLDAPYSTRTDNLDGDSGPVDIGYHYYDEDAPLFYSLTTNVIGDGMLTILTGSTGGFYIQYSQVLFEAEPDPENQFKQWQGTDDDSRIDRDPVSGDILMIQQNIVTMTGNKTVTAEFESIYIWLHIDIIGVGTVSPRKDTKYIHGAIVDLVATPSDLTEVVIWSGTDDDSVELRENTVTMAEPFTYNFAMNRWEKVVQVEFYKPNVLYYPGPFSTLQQAIDFAHDRDVLELLPGNEPYTTSQGFTIWGKDITIRSSDPEDPCTVASTVIEFDRAEDGFYDRAFTLGFVSSNTKLLGITIRGFYWNGLDGIDGDPDLLHFDGWHAETVYGSGILCYYSASPLIRNCIIEDCNALGGTGGDGANGNLGDGHPDGGHGGWPGKAFGGGLAALNGSNPTIKNTTFRNCGAVGGSGGDGGNGETNPPVGWGGRGGGWYYSFPPLTPYDDDWHYDDEMQLVMGIGTPFDYGGKGGAVYISPSSSAIFKDCRFIRNQSGGGFNGIYGQTGFPPNLRFEPNLRWKIDNFGGAVYMATGSTAKFTDCVFEGNRADIARPLKDDPNSGYAYNNKHPNVGYGGAVMFRDNAMPVFENCSFINNESTTGGAMYWDWAYPEMTDCNFLDNTAYHGGALYFQGGSTRIGRVSFRENKADGTFGQGGAICALGANVLIVDSKFESNYAAGSGGGIYTSSEDLYGQPISDGDKLQIKNCLIARNFSSNKGAGISSNEGAEPNIVGCTIVDNRVLGWDGLGGGFYCGDRSVANVINSIFWGNKAADGTQIAVGSGSQYDYSAVNVTHSNISNIESERIPDVIDDFSGAVRPGFDTNSLPANDDESTELVGLGFTINFFGQDYSDVYVNNNGNVTFNAPMATFTPWGLTTEVGTPIIAAFFADVDTRLGNIVAYGPNTIDGHDAFGVTWQEVGYFSQHTDKLNSFQLIIIDRSDRAVGDFDIEFNYDQIQWETGDITSPRDDGFGGQSARAGYSNGTGDPGTNYELEGSGVHGAFLDDNENGLIHGSRRSNVAGRYVYEVQSGMPEIPGGYGPPIFVGENCTLNWDPETETWFADSNNIQEDPCFIEGTAGYYYLSQIEAGQILDSDCINIGDGEAHVRGMYRHTTRTDGVVDGFDWGGNPDDHIVDIGYHYLLEADVIGDFDFDGDVDLDDLAIFYIHWLDSGCGFPDWCHEKDLNKDGMVNNTDYTIWAKHFGETESQPPYPDPMTWEIRPVSGAANPDTIVMTATTAYDIVTGTNVWYWFEEVTGRPGSSTSGWQSSPYYADSGLTPGLQYGYRVKAKDGYENETEWSATRYAIAGKDETPPEPNPMTWAVSPYATTGTSIRMQATTATDDSGGIQYYFDCLTVGGDDSGWQSSPIYEDVGLTIGTTYSYRVRAMDAALNTTGWSSTRWAITNLPPEPNIFFEPLLPPAEGSNSGQGQDSFGTVGYWHHIIVVELPPGTAPFYYFRFICLDEGGFSTTWLPTNGAGMVIYYDDPLTTEVLDATITYNGNMVTYDRVIRDGYMGLNYKWRVEASYVPGGGGPTERSSSKTVLIYGSWPLL